MALLQFGPCLRLPSYIRIVLPYSKGTEATDFHILTCYKLLSLTPDYYSTKKRNGGVAVRGHYRDRSGLKVYLSEVQQKLREKYQPSLSCEKESWGYSWDGNDFKLERTCSYISPITDYIKQFIGQRNDVIKDPWECEAGQEYIECHYLGFSKADAPLSL